MNTSVMKSAHDTAIAADTESPRLSEDTIRHIGLMPESALVAESSNRRNSSHFSDRIMESLLGGSGKASSSGSTLTKATEIKHNDQSEEEVDDEEEVEEIDDKPGLSIWIIANNFKELSKRLTPVLALQKTAISVLTWKSPSQTVSVLVAYTMICKWPHLLLAIPMLTAIFMGILPGFLYRHPIRAPHIITVKRRGRTLIEYFNSSNDESILTDLLDQDTETSSTSTRLSTVAESAAEIPEDAIDEVVEGIDKGEKFVKSQANLLSNMRHLQNAMTDVVRSLRVAEKLGYDLTGFANEKLSTSIFYGLLVATFVISVLGVYIPWQLIFIQTGWVLVILCHPNSKKYLEMLLKKDPAKTEVIKKKKSKRQTKSDRITSEENNLISTFDTKAIYPLDSPHRRTLEVFEIQYRSSTKPEWKNSIYCSSTFDLDDPKRARGKPRGTTDIWDVIPPKDWKFDFAYINTWEIDRNPAALISERALSRTLLTKNDAKDGWMYDKVKVLEADFDFRRRRLTRECYRYARSVWDPPY